MEESVGDSSQAFENQSLNGEQSLSDFFYSCLPAYLSIGMSAEEFWHGEPRLAQAYRKAEEMRFNRKNTELWLNGMYIYSAILRLTPAFNYWAKEREPIEYMSEPFAITEQQIKEQAQREEQRRLEQNKMKLEAFMCVHNAKLKQDEGSPK